MIFKPIGEPDLMLPATPPRATKAGEIGQPKAQDADRELIHSLRRGNLGLQAGEDVNRERLDGRKVFRRRWTKQYRDLRNGDIEIIERNLAQSLGESELEQGE
jgi:hypothetical protein